MVADEAADGGGGGGWMTWPPRSYSCSFCKREFRSAQALGGHMNVHRRDRALLKQASSPPSDRNHHHHHHHLKSPSKYPSHNIRANVPKHYLSPTRVSYSQDEVNSGVKKLISTNDASQAKMSMGFNFSKGRYRDREDNKEEKNLMSFKKFKKNCDNGVSLFPFFDEGNPNLQSMEGLDLELRLGLAKVMNSKV